MDRNSRQFKQLQAQWDRKLKDSGFEDIEDRETGLLTSWTGSYPINPFRSSRTGTLQERQDCQEEYYRIARQLLHTRTFKSALERKVWRMHSDGMPYSAIAKELGVTKRKVQSLMEAARKRLMGL